MYKLKLAFIPTFGTLLMGARYVLHVFKTLNIFKVIKTFLHSRR